MNEAAPAPGADWFELVTELGGQLARLRLWFEEGSPIVKSFQEMLAWCGEHGVELGKAATEKDATRVAMIDDEIGKARNRYLDAAREHLKAAVGPQFQVVSRTNDDSKWVIVVNDPVRVTTSYLYDRSNGKVLKLFDHAQSVQIVIERSSMSLHQLVQLTFAGMSEGRMADIMDQRERFG